jgi:hypothetical protein
MIYLYHSLLVHCQEEKVEIFYCLLLICYIVAIHLCQLTLHKNIRVRFIVRIEFNHII